MSSPPPRRSAAIAIRLLAAVAVALVALSLRLLAVDRLPIDRDEDDYLRAGQLYASGLRQGDLGVLLRENYRPEHPPLTKIVTGLAIAPLSPAPEIPDRPTTAPPAEALSEPDLTVARVVQAVEGTVGVLVLAVLSPLAGLFLATQTWTIKYTSQVMLEALPAALGAIAVVAYLGAGRFSAPGATSGRRRRWLVVAAIAFGLACASKYPYGIVGLAVLLDWGWQARPAGTWRDLRAVGRWLRPLAAWSGLAVAAFLLADPYLWPDPIGRLAASLGCHVGYAGSEAVEATGWPSWQPLVWLFGSVPFHASGTFVLSLDLVTTILAVLGVRRLWSCQRVMALWLLLALLFLLLWPTKWPQYLLLVTVPLSLAAAHGARLAVIDPLADRLGRVRSTWRAGPAARSGRAEREPASRRARRTLRDLGRALPWLAPGVLVLGVLVLLPLAYEAAMSLTDFSRASLRDGINGGIVREAIGGLTGAIPAGSFDIDTVSTEVGYVGFDLWAALTGGVWLGGNTSAQFPAFSVLWTVLVVGLQTVLGLGVALVLVRPGVRFAAAWRTLFILPWAIPEFVGAVAWHTILEEDNGWLALFMGRPFPWTGSPDLALVVLLAAGVWIGWPLMMLVATAGLRTISPSVIEAAQLDGAGAWLRFRSVLLPLLMPLLAPALVIRAVGAFNQFYLFYVLQPPVPTITSATWSYYLFDSPGGGGLFAVSAAVNVLTAVALGVIVAWFMRWRASAERVPLS